MAAADTTVQGRRPLQFCRDDERASRASCLFSTQQNRFLRRRFAVPSAALTAAPPAAVEKASSTMKTLRREIIMISFQTIAVASDRVVAALIAGLELEFGHDAAEGLAARFLAAEECEFTWEARIEERWIGTYEMQEADDALELDRVAVLSRLGHLWIVATCIVDGDGNAHGIIGRRSFRTAAAARTVFLAPH